MKEFKQLGTYGLVIQNGKILLIKKFGGPYDGKLDLPGGTIEFCERPEEALKRELMEEVGIEVVDYQLFDADSVAFEWQFKEDILVKVHHTGIFFKVSNYNNEIKKEIKVDEVNDDSLGAEFFYIDKLSKKELSTIAIMELEKLKSKYLICKSIKQINKQLDRIEEAIPLVREKEKIILLKSKEYWENMLKILNGEFYE